MISKQTKLILLAMFLLPLAGFYGCVKPQEFPVEPEITFRDLVAIGDSARVRFYFTDGDGDIGLNEDETSPPYDTGSKFYNNVFLRYYEKVNGAWVQGTTTSGKPIEFTYRTRKIEPPGKNKALKGEIIIYIVPSYYNPFSTNSDSVKFDIQLADRSLHLSNVVETTELYR